MSDNLSVSWTDVHRDTRELARRLMKHGPFTGIVAITRGGLIPAAIVARELNIRLIDTICAVGYDYDTQLDEVKIIKPVVAAEDEGNGWLIIDDLVDTGGTAKVVRELLPKAHFATIYAKPQGRKYVDTVVGEVPQNTWVFFPWDTEPQFIKPIAEVEKH